MEEPENLKGPVKEVLKSLKERVSTEEVKSNLPLCARCQDVGFVQVPNSPWMTYCECRYIKIAQSILATAPEPIRINLSGKRLIPKLIYRTFPEMTFNAEPIKPSATVARYGFSMKKQKELIESLSQDPTLGCSFYGPTGVGKSFLMWAKAQECGYAGNRVIYRTSGELVEGLRTSQETEASDPAISEIESIVNSRINIFIDEIDSYPFTEASLRKLFEFVDKCWRNISRIRITFASNISSKKLSSKIGMATYRRLCELTNNSYVLVGEE